VVSFTSLQILEEDNLGLDLEVGNREEVEIHQL
jgi:hypothetical protein